MDEVGVREDSLGNSFERVDFYTLKVAVQDSALSIVLARLEALPSCHVNRRVAGSGRHGWMITCYCSDYHAIDAVRDWHRAGEILEFQVV